MLPEDAGVARFPVAELHVAVQAMFGSAGLDEDKAASVTRALVGADMMGHATHGLALAPWYLDALAAGEMARSGQIHVLSDRGACLAWQGQSLPGAWLIDKAIDTALERVGQHGVVTVTIAGAHHTGALATYLPRLTSRGLMPILTCSGPGAAGVAPFGGTQGLFTPNPLSAGIPTAHDPILLDVSASITTNNRARQLARAGGRFPAPWALDAQGHVTDDPNVPATGGGTLLPVGGLDHGHKGYGLALLVEALTQGLSGLGRRTSPKKSLMNVFLQVIDPDAFGGRSAFVGESTWLADACRRNPPRPGVSRVRVPGEQGMALHRTAAAEGVPLADGVVAALRPCLRAAGVDLPVPMV